MDAGTIATIVVFLLVGFVVLAAFITLFSPPDPSSSFEPTKLAPTTSGAGGCTSGTKESCLDERGCPGTKTCSHGKWSACIAPRECEPGGQQYCPTPGCISGIQTCDRCGQWSECVPQ
ncbi:hypothetical protein GF412_04390 [Candidatus Micrarchaeota archaeon]|nr:hypothetical protein [Candidatus Micrarchaeota archaeon]MBD3418190.1 hypothetical protein [Candidatus Micrarchaeota archaeon]